MEELNQESNGKNDQDDSCTTGQKRKTNYRTKSYCHPTSMALGRREWISKSSCND